MLSAAASKKAKNESSGGGRAAKKPKPPPPPAIPTTIPTILDKRDTACIKAHFDTHGYAVVQVCDTETCKQAIVEQVKKILKRQPWMQQLEVKDRVTGNFLDIDSNEAQYVAELTTPGIPKEALMHYDEVWPLHKGFGACCDPVAFHLDFEWQLRQDESLYAIARAIMQGGELYVTIDRCIHKLPGKGDDEFLHWDLPIFNLGNRTETEMCLKICFTDAEFICVPGTHTLQFAEDFKAAYQPLYPNAKPSAAKFGLDPKKPDPMDLRSKRVAIHIPAGCALVWSPYLLHGTRKSPKTSGVAFGMYMGYMRDIDRPGYKTKEPGIDGERQDRIDSYGKGRAPARYPSLDPTHYYPFRYYNFPKMLKKYVDMTPPGYAGRGERTIKSGENKGTIVPELIPMLDPHYQPYPLTKLGKMLLGITPVV
jgi:ectoine hydroxylase-related dioxygenase (phytanoyl-CoA dioxygenase family)